MAKIKNEAYEKYVAGVKKLGGTQIATPSEFKIIQKRLGKRNWVSKLKKKVLKEFKTKRTIGIEKRLRSSGLTDKEIAKFRGKKK